MEQEEQSYDQVYSCSGHYSVLRTEGVRGATCMAELFRISQALEKNIKKRTSLALPKVVCMRELCSAKGCDLEGSREV